MNLPFVDHLLETLSAWWQRFDPVVTIKHAVDTLNSFGLTKAHVEAVATEIIAVKDAPLSGMDKALHVAATIADWTGPDALPPQAADNLHVIISLVHLVARLSGKIE